MAYKLKVDHLTNNHYGDYGGRPNGSVRRVKPKLLMCIHITDGLADAQHQRDYANHTGDPLRSAHDYINRDGSVVEAVDPEKYAAWSNGDLKSPDAKHAPALVKTILDAKAQGYNPNEMFYREVENVGDASHTITYEQKLTMAQMIAADSKKTGIAISRATIGMHRDINTETRPNCPFTVLADGTTRNTQLAQIITLALVMSKVHP